MAKYKRPFRPNIGVLVFLIIFIYIIINLMIYYSKDHLSIYEVVEGKNSDDNICSGIAIREEKVIKTNKAGYVNYYLKEGERVAKNAVIYTLDESGTIYDQLKTSETESKLSSNDIIKVRNEINSFKKEFDNSNNYSYVYDFKYNIDNTILELNNFNMLQNLDEILETSGKNSFKIVKSPASGIVSYSLDQMEDLKATDVTTSTFDTSSYTRTQLRTTDLLEQNSPVYKLVTSEDWSVIIHLSKEQYDKIYDKDTIKITFVKDGLSTSSNVTSYQKGKDYFAKLDLNKYMVRYIGDRYLDIELLINSASGLKIPVSSIVTKEFYKVPLEYFTEGGDTNSKGVVKESYNKNGDVNYEFVATDIYYDDGTYGYIDARLFHMGDLIRVPDSKNRYEINEKDELIGVYNINKGYAVFRRIEKLYENEEYCIIKTDTPYGLSAYDHIALKGNTVVEQAIIY